MSCVIWSSFIKKMGSSWWSFRRSLIIFSLRSWQLVKLKQCCNNSNESARKKKTLKIKMAPVYYPDISVPSASFQSQLFNFLKQKTNRFFTNVSTAELAQDRRASCTRFRLMHHQQNWQLSSDFRAFMVNDDVQAVLDFQIQD